MILRLLKARFFRSVCQWNSDACPVVLPIGGGRLPTLLCEPSSQNRQSVSGLGADVRSSLRLSVPRAGRCVGAPALYVAGLASIVALAGYAAHKAAAALIQKLNAVLAETTVFGTEATAAALPVVEKRIVLNEEWKDAIRSETFWRSRGSSNSSSGPSSSSGAPVKAPQPHTAVPQQIAPAPQRTTAMRL